MLQCILLKVINDNRGSTDGNDIKIPLLVYVSRERRPSYPHRFKAGALNALVCSALQIYNVHAHKCLVHDVLS